MEKARLQPTRIQPVRLKRNNKENRRIQTEQDESKPSSLLRGRGKALSTEKGSSGAYTTLEAVGKGTFGAVYKAKDSQGRVVAIKKVLQDKNFKNREQQILKMLDHPNVLCMRDSYFTQSGSKIYLNVVMDYYPTDLFALLKSYAKKKTRMPLELVRALARQMFQALDYLRSISVCHRDLKPHNILVDTRTAALVVCDFGSAKVLDPR
jgi:serine/threonine protein kinase